MKKLWIIPLFIILVSGCISGAGVQAGDTVKVDYWLTIGGEMIQTTEDSQPIAFTVGRGEVVPGFDSAVLGMSPGQEKSVTLTPDQAYGEIDQENIIETFSKDLPENITVGETITATDESGMTRLVTILEIKNDTALLDFNHPLAGKTLEFRIILVEIVE